MPPSGPVRMAGLASYLTDDRKALALVFAVVIVLKPTSTPPGFGIMGICIVPMFPIMPIIPVSPIPIPMFPIPGIAVSLGRAGVAEPEGFVGVGTVSSGVV